MSGEEETRKLLKIREDLERKIERLENEINDIKTAISEIDSTIFEDMSDELRQQCSLTMRFDFEELPTVSFYDFHDFLRIITPDLMRRFCARNTNK